MSAVQPAPDTPTRLSDDLLKGADEIAEFLFGSPQRRRQVYHLVATSRLPVIRIGAKLCARRSTLMNWIEAQEMRIVR